MPTQRVLADRRIKPEGTPTINWGKAPRGLLYCFPFADARWREARTGAVPGTKSGTTLSTSPFGRGMSFTTAAGSIGYSISGLTNTAPFSLEVLLWLKTQTGAAPDSDAIALANNTNNASTTLFAGGVGHYNSDGSNTINANGNGGVTAVKSGTNPAAKSLLHAICVWNTATLFLYLRGAATVSTGLASTQNAVSAVLFGSVASSDNAFDGVYLLGNVSKAAWRADEVYARFNDPYGFLDYPQDRRARTGTTDTVVSTFTYFDLTQPDITNLIRRAEMQGY